MSILWVGAIALVAYTAAMCVWWSTMVQAFALQALYQWSLKRQIARACFHAQLRP